MEEGKLRHLQPDFYESFRCRASACRHSCCKGWEIDIDENTLELYQNLSGEWKEKMDADIICDDSGAHFRLTEDERCPFLQPSGLCELICAFGEDALCDICALHPRFYELVGPYELAGLGLSCEAVCDLLLAEKGELMLRCEETGEMIVEGYRECRRALDNGYRPHAIFHCPELYLKDENEPQLVADAERAGADVYLCSKTAFVKMAYKERPDGLLMVGPHVAKRLSDLTLPPNALVIVTESIEKPGNLGTILRSADAAKVSAVIVCDRTTDIHNPKPPR